MKKSASAPVPNTTMQRLVDLREILRYVPQYRDKVFVIAFDGAVVEHDNFRNLLLDLRVGCTIDLREIGEAALGFGLFESLASDHQNLSFDRATRAEMILYTLFLRV